MWRGAARHILTARSGARQAVTRSVIQFSDAFTHPGTMAGNNIYSMSNVIMFRRILGLTVAALAFAIAAPAFAQGVAAEYKLHAGDKIEISV